MNRVEFMKQLEALLFDISSSEKKEAIQYYNDYFDDAGVENEDEVINELGTPEKVAITIKESHGIKEEAVMEDCYEAPNQKTNDTSGFTHKGFEDSNSRNYNNNQNHNNNQNYNTGQNNYQQPQRSNGNTALIMIISIITFPIWFPVLMGLLGAAFGIVIALFGMVFGFGLAGILLVITSIILLGFSLVKLAFAPLGGLCLVGISLLLCGIAILMCMLAYAIAFKLIPALVRGIFKLCQMPFRNKGGCIA